MVFALMRLCSLARAVECGYQQGGGAASRGQCNGDGYAPTHSVADPPLAMSQVKMDPQGPELYY